MKLWALLGVWVLGCGAQAEGEPQASEPEWVVTDFSMEPSRDVNWAIVGEDGSECDLEALVSAAERSNIPQRPKVTEEFEDRLYLTGCAEDIQCYEEQIAVLKALDQWEKDYKAAVEANRITIETCRRVLDAMNQEVPK